MPPGSHMGQVLVVGFPGPAAGARQQIEHRAGGYPWPGEPVVLVKIGHAVVISAGPDTVADKAEDTTPVRGEELAVVQLHWTGVARTVAALIELDHPVPGLSVVDQGVDGGVKVIEL